jgi:NADP-dependent 3-hydroxy acid dehydrogenase YdfG
VFETGTASTKVQAFVYSVHMQINPQTVAVITGAGSGIGRALALNLAAKGAALAIADVNEANLEETRSRIQGVKVSSHVVDVSNKGRVNAFASEVQEAHGKANLIVNNAGVALGGLFEECSLEDMEWLIGINFWGVVYGCRAFMPMLRREPSAHIVNVSSVFGIIAPVGQTAYSAAKFAVRGFSESLRHELEGSNIRLSVVHPGGIKTSIARNARLGAHSQQRQEVVQAAMAKMEKSFTTSSEDAAERIAQGILRDEPRILIGKDATQIDRIQRVFPTTYWSMIKRFLS